MLEGIRWRSGKWWWYSVYFNYNLSDSIDNHTDCPSIPFLLQNIQKNIDKWLGDPSINRWRIVKILLRFFSNGSLESLTLIGW